MTVSQIEKRITALEAEVANLKSSRKARNPWWDKIAGVFAGNPRFEKAMGYARGSHKPGSKPQRSRSRGRTSPKAAK